MTDTSVPSRLKAGRREWVGLAVLSSATLFVAFDFFVLLLALPQIGADLEASSVQLLWIVDTYGFMVGGLLITMGAVGDRIGRRRLLLLGAGGFGVASLLAAFSTSPEMLIAARALLGVAGATLGPMTLGLISTMFQDPQQRGSAIGVWAGTFTLGAIAGPLVGGLMLDHFWWGSVFLLALPVSVLVVALAPIVVPESKSEEPGRIDLFSVGLSLAAILPVIYGIKVAASDGWSAEPVVAIVLGLTFGVVFSRRQLRLDDPLLDLGLFRNSSLSVPLTGLLVLSIVGGAGMLFLTGYLQMVAGLSPVEASLALLPGLVAGTIGVLLAPRLAARIRPALLISGGLVLVVLAQLMITRLDGELWLSIAAFCVQTVGGAPLLALGVGLVVGAAPVDKAGSAASIAQVGNELGAALGAATLGSVGIAVYRRELSSGSTASTDVPAEAREGLAGALAAADELPSNVAAALVREAENAFTSGWHVVACLSAAAIVATMALISRTLWHVPPFGAAGTEAEAGSAPSPSPTPPTP